MPNEWSAMDCLCHLLDTERWIFPKRVQALLAGENFVGFDPDKQGTHYTTQDAINSPRSLRSYAKAVSSNWSG